MKRLLALVLTIGVLAILSAIVIDIVVAHAGTVLFPIGGGTGTSTPPTYGQLLVGNSGGTYTLTATSSLGISGGGGTPGGSSGQLQYNGSGAFAGVATSTLTASSPLTGSFTHVGVSGSLGCQTASDSQAGCLSAADHVLFNSKLSTDPNWAIVGGNLTPTTTIPIYLPSTASVGTSTSSGFLTIQNTASSGANLLTISSTTSTGASTTLSFSSTGILTINPNPNFERVRQGGLIVNNNVAPPINLDHSGGITLISEDNDDALLSETSYGGSSDDWSTINLRQARGTGANPTQTLAGDVLGRVSGRGYQSGGAFTGSTASIDFRAAETYTSTNQGSYAVIGTTPIGSVGGGSTTSPAESTRFEPTGGVSIGTWAYNNIDPGQGFLSVQNGIIDAPLATPAGTFLAADPSGKLIATTTPSGGGSGTVGSGTTGQFPYYASSGTTLTATSSIFLAASGNVGIGTTTPIAELNVTSAATSYPGQIALTDPNAGTNLKSWFLSSEGGNFYIGTSTDAGATSTVASITIVPASASTTGAIGLDAAVTGRNGLSSNFTQSLTGVGVTTAMSIGNIYIGAMGNIPIHGLDANATWSGTVSNTQASTAGGVVGASYQVNNNGLGLNVLRMSALNATCAENQTLASTTNCVEFNASAPSLSTGNTVTNFYGLVTPGTITGSGTVTNYVGADLVAATAGTNNTDLLIGTSTAPLGNQSIYDFSSKDSYFAGEVGFNVANPNRGQVEIMATTSANTSHPLTIWNSGGSNIFEVGGDGSTTASNGFNITAGCYAVNGTCLTSGGGGSGTVTSIATNNGITGGTITTTGTIGLAAIAANSVLGNITGGSAVPTALATSSLFLNASATNTGLLTSTDWSTFNGKLSTVTTDSTLTGAGTGGSPLGLALTHANTWTGLQQFNGGASSTIAFSAPSLCISTDCRTAWPASGGTVGSGTTGQFPYYAAGGTTLTATSSLSLATSGVLTIPFGFVSQASSTISTLHLGTALENASGGTGQSTYTTGNILYASASNVLSKLAVGTTGQVLTIVGGIPSWQTVATSSYQDFTGNGTWTKPTAVTTNSFTTIQIWGAGGGGGGWTFTGAGTGSGAGGGGGSYFEVTVPTASLASSVSITVGTGGSGTTGGAASSCGVTGGDSSFGTLFKAFGGGGGCSSYISGTLQLGAGGGGAGYLADGIVGSQGGTSPTGGTGGGLGGGVSNTDSTTGFGGGGGGGGISSVSGQSIYGGGGGGGGTASGVGGNTIYGGGGGGDSRNAGAVTAGGTSQDGGGGGAACFSANCTGTAGTAPAGGGGGGGFSNTTVSNGGAGARGEVRVFTTP